MRRRYLYWPISLLPILLVFVIWTVSNMFSGTSEDNFFTFCFLSLFFGYIIYFNYPAIHTSLQALGKKSRKDKQAEKPQKEDKLADKHLGVRNSAKDIYEFLKPARFVSDHAVYRVLTLVYAMALALFVALLYYYVPSGSEKQEDYFPNLLYASILVSVVIAYTSILRFGAIKWRDYPYYLAKAYIALSESETELAVRLRYLIEGMEAYNLFLQRNLKIKIRDLQTFYSLLSSDKVKIQQEIIKNLSLTFHSDKQDNDELEPFRGIKNTMETYYNKELVIGVSKKRTLQDWLPPLGLIVSSTIAIIQIFVR